MRYLLYFIIFITARNVNSQTILPSFSAVHHKRAVDWSPTNVNASGWIDASDASSIIKDGGNNIIGITDNSGNTFDVSGSGNPTSGSSNGISYIEFTDNSFDGSSNINITDGNGNHWAVGIFQWTAKSSATSGKRESFWSVDAGNSSKDYAISAGNTGAVSWEGETDLTTKGDVGSLAKVEWNTPVAKNEWVIISVIFNKSENVDQIRSRQNGEEMHTALSYNTSLSQSQKIKIMRNRANVRIDGGKVVEWFFVSDIPGTGGTDITNVEKAEGYLAHRWGLTSILHSSHPYKTLAPTN